MSIVDDRDSVYGDPVEMMGVIAKMWSSYLGTDIMDYDVPAMMALFKAARIEANPSYEDSYIDLDGYKEIERRCRDEGRSGISD
jgi:hypothetical protein